MTVLTALFLSLAAGFGWRYGQKAGKWFFRISCLSVSVLLAVIVSALLGEPEEDENADMRSMQYTLPQSECASGR